MLVEWDGAKAAANEKKHGVSFSEAVSALEDPLSVTFRPRSPATSFGSSPSVTARRGVSLSWLTDRGDAVRLISARRASRAERRVYEEGIGRTSSGGR